MRPKKLFIILILISLILLPVTPALADVTTNDIAKQLMCACGTCELVLSACHCDLPDGAAEMRAIIEQQLAQGKPQEEILDYFVARYGAQVLAPPKQDSNLVLWVLALTGILAVGVVIYLTQKKRARRK